MKDGQSCQCYRKVGTKTPLCLVLQVTLLANINLGLRQTVCPMQAQENKEEYSPPSLPNDWKKYIDSYGTVTYTNKRLDQTQYEHPSNLRGKRGLQFWGLSKV